MKSFILACVVVGVAVAQPGPGPGGPSVERLREMCSFAMGSPARDEDLPNCLLHVISGMIDGITEIIHLPPGVGALLQALEAVEQALQNILTVHYAGPPPRPERKNLGNEFVFDLAHLEFLPNECGLVKAYDLQRNEEGTVCDDSFNDKAARFVCERNGYPNQSADFDNAGNVGAAFGKNLESEIPLAGPVLLDDFNCTSPGNCSALTEHNCRFHENVVVCCGGKTFEDALNEYRRLHPTTGGSGGYGSNSSTGVYDSYSSTGVYDSYSSTGVYDSYSESGAQGSSSTSV